MGALLLLSTWLSLTIACQSHRGAARITPFDDFALIPLWTFFAPKPGTTDFQVLFRDRLFDDQLTSWRELDSSSGSVYLRWIWNPDKRKSKAIFDIATTLPGTALEDPTDASTVVSIPYLCLLKQACSAPRNRLSVETQFAVAMSSGISPPGSTRSCSHRGSTAFEPVARPAPICHADHGPRCGRRSHRLR